MITSLQLVDFKNFANEVLQLGPFTVIVGANASGKSNIRDAFRFLHGVGRGYTLADIIGGKYGAGGNVEWEPIRGAPSEVGSLWQNSAYFRFLLSIGVKKDNQLFEYSIGVESDKQSLQGFRIFREELYQFSSVVYTSHPGEGDPVHSQRNDTHLLLRMGKTGSQKKHGARISVRPDQPALTQIREHREVRRVHKEISEYVASNLGNMRFLDLALERMRRPAFPGQVILGDGGENLPTVLRDICTDPDRKKDLIDWIRELTPMDVVDFEFPIDPITGLVNLVICESDDVKLSAYSVSDGTLRFLAMLAALLNKNTGGLYCFEEIDNGIHPSRLRLLVDLIESQTEKGHIQVVATTHSPDLLSIVNDNTFENTSVVCRQDGTGSAIIRPVSGITNAGELRRSQGLGRLLAGGWMETALAFTEGGTSGEETAG